MSEPVGYVYCLSNPIYRAESGTSILKIGTTGRTIVERMNELFSTEMPVPFFCETALIVKTNGSLRRAEQIEIALHSMLVDCWVGGEFFEISVEDAIHLFDMRSRMSNGTVSLITTDELQKINSRIGDEVRMLQGMRRLRLSIETGSLRGVEQSSSPQSNMPNSIPGSPARAVTNTLRSISVTNNARDDDEQPPQRNSTAAIERSVQHREAEAATAGASVNQTAVVNSIDQAIVQASPHTTAATAAAQANHNQTAQPAVTQIPQARNPNAPQQPGFCLNTVSPRSSILPTNLDTYFPAGVPLVTDRPPNSAHFGGLGKWFFEREPVKSFIARNEIIGIYSQGKILYNGQSYDSLRSFVQVALNLGHGGDAGGPRRRCECIRQVDGRVRWVNASELPPQ